MSGSGWDTTPELSMISMGLSLFIKATKGQMYIIPHAKRLVIHLGVFECLGEISQSLSTESLN